MPGTIARASRGVSPFLLVLAALCFLLPFAGVSCNTAAGGAALNSALSAAGGAGNPGTAAAASTCLQALNGRDLASYSGINMLTGSNPSTTGSVPGCDTSPSSSTSASANEGGIGVQPLVLVAFILIVVGIAAALLRRSMGALVAGGAALIAGVLLVINNATVHVAITNRLTEGTTGASLATLGISNAADQFFNVHAALGLWLVLAALLLALLVNLTEVAVGSGLRLSTAPPQPEPPPEAEPPPSA